MNLRIVLLSVLCAGIPLHATAIIDATFDPSLTAGEQAAINTAITNLESSITSPHNVVVSIYFTATNSGLGQDLISLDMPSYYDYYNAFKAVATSPNQLAALNSLGTAPGSQSSDSPVPGTGSMMLITTAEARNLGFSGVGPGVTVHSSNYDGEIMLNTSITSPPGTLNSGTYSLQSVAARNIDDVLGLGATGSSLNTLNQGIAGDLDLFRYSANNVRSYTTSTSATSYFSVDGGQTALSYFNQSGAGDYGDWQSNPDHVGFGPQVQDAFSTPGVNPVLGSNEVIALNAIGYGLVTGAAETPEPSTAALAGLALALAFLRHRRTLGR